VLRLTLLFAAALVACGPEPITEPDAGAPDAGQPAVDAGPPGRDGGADAGIDAGTVIDAGVAVDAGAPDAGPNTPPVVAAAIVQSRTTAFAGQLVELALGATDADGDRLRFTWSGPGRFFENGSPSAQRWFSDEVTTATTVTLSVSVTDGRSPPETRTATVEVTVPRFQDVHGTVLATPVLQGGQCVGCHGTMGQYQISIDRQVAWQQLVGAPHHRGAGCTAAGFSSLVVAGDAQRSLLYRKMSSTQPTACGDGMPAGTVAVPASPLQHIVTVGSWIRAGARND
jgi:hypothetical protein